MAPTITDSQRIARGISDAKAEEREIDEATARLIASQWHNGQSSLLYAFASTGRLAGTSQDTWMELETEYRNAYRESDREAMNFLGTYLVTLENATA
jgi:hypothetical protein